jgi:hypothetical protein
MKTPRIARISQIQKEIAFFEIRAIRGVFTLRDGV